MTIHPEITSTKNPVVARFREVAQGDCPDLVVVDGLRLVWDAVRAGLPIRIAATSPKLLGAASGHDLRARLASNADDFYPCDERVLAKLSTLEVPQGAIAIVELAPTPLAELLTARAGVAPLIVVAAGVRDPGNLGAIIRSAEAAGASGCVVMSGSADPFRDKAVRGSSGSILRLPTARGVSPADLVAAAAKLGAQLVVADGGADRDYVDVDFRKPTFLVVGAEGSGIPPALLDAPGCVRVGIPMCEPVESLNVAVAAGVVMFEARRQRR